MERQNSGEIPRTLSAERCLQDTSAWQEKAVNDVTILDSIIAQQKSYSGTDLLTSIKSCDTESTEEMGSDGSRSIDSGDVLPSRCSSRPVSSRLRARETKLTVLSTQTLVNQFGSTSSAVSAILESNESCMKQTVEQMQQFSDGVNTTEVAMTTQREETAGSVSETMQSTQYEETADSVTERMQGVQQYTDGVNSSAATVCTSYEETADSITESVQQTQQFTDGMNSSEAVVSKLYEENESGISESVVSTVYEKTENGSSETVREIDECTDGVTSTETILSSRYEATEYGTSETVDEMQTTTCESDDEHMVVQQHTVFTAVHTSKQQQEKLKLRQQQEEEKRKKANRAAASAANILMQFRSTRAAASTYHEVIIDKIATIIPFQNCH